MTTLGTILEIQRMSTDDGPGIRSTVFFKGCSLACTWCHNPESISRSREVVWHDWRCIGCRECVRACPRGARALTDEGALLDRERCEDCGACIDACPATALERQGRLVTVEQVVDEVARDRAYYEASGGGVTLSGGEPVLQRSFAASLLDALGALGIHRALDTCGMSATEPLLELADRSELVLFDLKLLDTELHHRYTKAGNERILANLEALTERMRGGQGPKELWIRTPLIPGATATAANLTAIGAHIASTVGGLVDRWDLCAFNNLCLDKYGRLGREWDFAGVPLLTAQDLEELAEVARGSGVRPELVRVSGPTRPEPRGEDEPRTGTKSYCAATC